MNPKEEEAVSGSQVFCLSVHWLYGHLLVSWGFIFSSIFSLIILTFYLVSFLKYFVFRNSSFLLLNGYCIYGLCLTFWTNEFLGSYSNYKFIISFSIFNRMGLWRTLCLQSFIEEVLSLSFSIPIFLLWFYNSSSFLSLFETQDIKTQPSAQPLDESLVWPCKLLFSIFIKRKLITRSLFLS